LQSAEHPSPLTVLPSSQASPSEGWTMPSPQRGAGLQGEPGIGHTKPLSSWQLLLQPSPATVFPSSHFSPASMRLFPHCEVRTQDCPATQV
jgi:hypothetical protein